jgi:hypothetical protein
VQECRCKLQLSTIRSREVAAAFEACPEPSRKAVSGLKIALGQEGLVPNWWRTETVLSKYDMRDGPRCFYGNATEASKGI